MNRKPNWVAIAITVLLLLNIGLMATIWLQKEKSRDADTTEGPQRGGPGALLVRELGFDSLQRLRFDSLRNDHHSRVEGYRNQMRDLKERFFAGIRRNEPASDSIAAAIGSLQGQIDRSTYDHFRLVRALCNDSQKEKFDRIINRVLGQMGAPPRQHRPGPPGDDRPDGPPHDGPPEGRPDGPPPGDN
ncbi:hypothetical protein [Flaviaesturariibacter terrae]